jgi:hypothetical protein
MRRFFVPMLGVGVLSGCTSGTNGTPAVSAVDAAAAQDARAELDASTDVAASDAAGGVDAAADAVPCAVAEDATVDATLAMTVDDNFKLYVNGVLIDDTPRVWSNPQTYAIKLFRNPSRKNVIAVEGINTQQIDGADRGVVVDMKVTVDGTSGAVLSDASWKLSTTLDAAWFDPSYPEVGWIAATEEGPHGMAPWGSVLGTSSAKWIWSYDSNKPASQKTAQETIYVRKTFYFDMTGAVVGNVTACP